jgi:hypothetical protein
LSELIKRVNWVDVLSLILLLRITYVSSRVGVGRQVLPLGMLTIILTVVLHCYSTVAATIAERLGIDGGFSAFMSYLVLVLSGYLIYKIIGRLTGAVFVREDGEVGSIEKVGGAIFGICRAFIIIGLVTISLLLTPIRYVDYSVKHSLSGFFFVDMNVKLYSMIVNSFFKEKKAWDDVVVRKLLQEKRKYLFKTDNLKNRSRFFQDRY